MSSILKSALQIIERGKEISTVGYTEKANQRYLELLVRGIQVGTTTYQRPSLESEMQG